MIQEFASNNRTDGDGNPTGGRADSVGMHISWQDGPLGRGEDRKDANGAFVETVIAAAMQRIQFYEEARGGKFACVENKAAIESLKCALASLNARTKARESRGVEGTHTA